jgi:hypothetical protein
MEKEQIAGQLNLRPITDSGQLLLVLVINHLDGEDGWVYKTAKELGKLACMGKTASYGKLNELEKIGVIEWQRQPPQAFRLVRVAALGYREAAPEYREAVMPTESKEYREAAPEYREAALEYREAVMPTESKEYREAAPEYREAVPEYRQANSPSPSAYLPLKDKDLKEEEEEEKKTASPSSSSSSDLVLVASNETPKSPRLDQPAAQPPAVVEQGDLLPAKPKAKKKRAPAKIPPARITPDWQPDARTLEICQSYGISEEHCWQQVPEFILHFEETGEARAGWKKSFVNWMKRSIKWEREDEQKSEQRERYTDASGRRLSEATVTMQDAHDNVLAHADFFASLDPNKPV